MIHPNGQDGITVDDSRSEIMYTMEVTRLYVSLYFRFSGIRCLLRTRLFLPSSRNHLIARDTPITGSYTWNYFSRDEHYTGNNSAAFHVLPWYLVPGMSRWSYPSRLIRHVRSTPFSGAKILTCPMQILTLFSFFEKEIEAHWSLSTPHGPPTSCATSPTYNSADATPNVP